MPTPLIAFRLPAIERAALEEMAKLYGSPNMSAFLREMVGAMCSGDVKRVQTFNVQLFQRVGEQLALQLTAPAMEMSAGSKSLHAKRTKRTKRKKRT